MCTLVLLMNNLCVRLMNDGFVHLMNNILMSLMNDRLMNLADLLLIDDWLVQLVDDRLMVLVNDVLVVLMDHVLVMLMDHITMRFLNDGWLGLGYDLGCASFRIYHGPLHVSLQDTGLLMSDNGCCRNLRLHNYCLLGRLIKRHTLLTYHGGGWYSLLYRDYGVRSLLLVEMSVDCDYFVRLHSCI